MATELTLAAAIRDAVHHKPDVRNVAIRNLAPALLDELGERPPVWWARSEHRRRDEVVALLERSCEDKSAQNVGLALLGLAQLGAPQARERAKQALDNQRDDADSVFVRECAVIALSLIGSSARQWIAHPASGSADTSAAERMVQQVIADLRPLLDDPREDVRFQAGPALVEVAEQAAEPELLAALERERHEAIRENLISALAMLDPPGPAACDELARILGTDEGRGPVGWEAARALAAARRSEGGPRLVAALKSRALRDDALEALAVLGTAAPPEAAEAVAKLTRGFLVPVFTQVRAAYALARIQPSEGEVRLAELDKHLRESVREAVGEARANLAKLHAEDRRRDGSAYRRD